MSAQTVRMWRMGRDRAYRDAIEEVDVLRVSSDYWLVIGDDQTHHRSAFYDSREKCLRVHIAQAETSVRYAEDRLARLRAMEKDA